MPMVKIPDHQTPRGAWCRFSGCQSLSGICWACLPDQLPPSPPPEPGTLQFAADGGEWVTALRGPTALELATAARTEDGVFWLTAGIGRPYTGAQAQVFDRRVRVTRPGPDVTG